jgi:hypothetical protein
MLEMTFVDAQLLRTGGGLLRTGVAVEKLILARLAENSSRQDALQAIFSGWVDIFYHRIRGRFRRKRVFQQPQAKALVDQRRLGRVIRSIPNLLIDLLDFLTRRDAGIILW